MNGLISANEAMSANHEANEQQLAIDFDIDFNRPHLEERQRMQWLTQLPLKQRELKCLIICDQLADVEAYGTRDTETPFGSVILDPPLSVIAERSRQSKSTVRRALQDLGETPWCEYERGVDRPGMIVIDWPTIRMSVEGYQLSETGVPAKTGGGTNFGNEESQKRAKGYQLLEPPKPEIGGGTTGRTNSLHDHEIHISVSHDQNHEPSCDPALEPLPAPSPQPNRKVNAGSKWWPEEITKALLLDLKQALPLLWPHAVAKYAVADSEQNKIGFAAACICAGRKGKSPGKLLTDLTKRQAWNTAGERGIPECYIDEARLQLRPQRRESTSDLGMSDGTPAGLRKEAAALLAQADQMRAGDRPAIAERIETEANSLFDRADKIEALARGGK